MTVTDQMISAYADGELSGEDKARVEAAIAADPSLAELVAKHRALKETLGAHFAPVLDQPVPENLAAMLQPKEEEPSGGGADVVSFATERQKRGLPPMVRRWAPIASGAIAAALVLAVVQPWQMLGGTADGYAGTQLASALDTQLVADQPADAGTRILLSFENDAGQYCRAYRAAETGGIACRDATGWKIERELGLDGAQVTEFRQAGSEADLMIAVQEMATGGALNAEGEAAAKERGWR